LHVTLAAAKKSLIDMLGRYTLDLKLALRMLRRFWGLTVVGGFAITIVVALATGIVSMMQSSLGSVPLDEGERLVALTIWDAERQRHVRPGVEQFERWRDALVSVRDLSAFTNLERRPASAPGAFEQPVDVAAMTASGFRAARVPPLLGRTLVEADERPGARAVVVISYDVWRSRYGADPDVIGQSLNLSGAAHDVIGVMPEGFAFPVNHRYWTSLQSAVAEGSAGLFVFGRLASGYALETAQAEVEAIGTEPLPNDDSIDDEPQVVPYTLALISSGGPLGSWLAASLYFLVSLLLLPPCLNIAILVYARTVTRQEELVTRYVLGASRSRIVTQLFLEMFVLALLSVMAAILLVHGFFGLELFRSDGDPFWVDYTQVSVGSIPLAAVLAIVAALIAGTIPAAQITRRMQRQGLGTPSNRVSTQLGATWTVLVVAQVALAVAALPAAIELGWGKLRPALVGPGFAAEQYVTFALGVDRELADTGTLGQTQDPASLRETQRRLIERLEDEPGILAATSSSALPGLEPPRPIEIAALDVGPSQGTEFVRFNQVDASFLDVFGIAVVVGRQFETSDRSREVPPVVVNRTLADRIGGRAVGQRVRIAAPGVEAGGWQEIIGVVADHPQNSEGPRVYEVQTDMPPQPLISLHLRSGASEIAPRLGQIVAGVDPSLYVTEVRSLTEAYRQIEIGNNVQFVALGAVTLSILFLSVAGVYALLSFTVNRKRQEIGIRSALGAQPSRIVFGVFRRALWQVGAGALLGLGASVLLDNFVPMEPFGGRAVTGVLPIVAATMILIGCLAALAPARRALRVAPTDALRDIG
jgi:predicted permease